MQCKNCFANAIIKNGKVHGKQRFQCKICCYNFVERDGRITQETLIKKAFAVIIYALGKASYGFIAKLFGVTPPAVLKWLKKEAAVMEEPGISATIKNIAFDEMWHFIQSKKTRNGSSKQWIVIEGWVIGNRDVKTFRRLYDKDLKSCTFYTDDWIAFKQVLPPECLL